MATPFYSWYVGTLRDGRITNRIPLQGASWQVTMDDAGALSGTLPLADPDVAALAPRVSAEPCRCFLAVSYTDSQGTETFLEAGPIWTHGYDTASRQLTIGAAGVWSYYDHRKVLPVLAAGINPSTQTTSYTAALGTIAKRLVQLAHTHTGGALPVVLPDDESGSDLRAYRGFDMTNVGDALRQLSQVIGGPEIQFVPRRRADDGRFLEWVMRVGTGAAPLLTQDGDDWAWDGSAQKAALGNITVTRDGSGVAQRWWVQGAGTDTTTMWARAEDTTLIDAGFPLLEASDTAHAGEDGAKRQSTIDDYAAGDLINSQQPKETWALTMNRDGIQDEDTGEWVGANVGDWRVGDWAAITPPTDDPYIPPGTYRTRITQLAGDDSNQVTVAVGQMIGAG